ncbi:MAG: DUF309 domain-containing protein, partial [Planctomycetales bacterium]|nr:DUF309 domain-containing protein [Planctomycetales bacterium]
RAVLDAGRRPRAGGDLHLHPTPALPAVARGFEGEEEQRLYAQGIAYFNDCEFFEAHEVWEELWTEYRGPSRKFLQGLIQAAVALHHFGNGNVNGAAKVYRTSRGYLEGYLPRHLGLDLNSFLASYAECFAALLAEPEERPEIDPELIPEIHLT